MAAHGTNLTHFRGPGGTAVSRAARDRILAVIWIGFAIVGLLLLDVVQDDVAYGAVIVALAGVLAVVSARLVPQAAWAAFAIDGRDLAAIGVLYAAVVGLLTVAFQVFTIDRTAGLFIAFALALLLGVAGPVVYTMRRGRPLASLGLGTQNLKSTVALGLVLAGVQFALTLYGYDLPTSAEDWAPLLGMALVVGLFESVFFRGFVQGRLQASFGFAGGVAGASVLYALYHVGYGMGAAEMVFLLGLGIVYAVSYCLVGNVLVLWPLLTPLGSFYANLEAGDIDLPWASLAGFGDVFVLMLVVLLIAQRRHRRRTAAS
jgi:membrane protease YdiL (CAAX protease family)